MRKLLAPLLVIWATGCTEPKAPAPQIGTTQRVFDVVSPSVVAILNDDRAERDREARATLIEEGKDMRVPKTVVDVTLRRDPMPNGTGFAVEGGFILTAAHVITAPDRLKLTTRFGQTVKADLVYLDEVRDVAILKPAVPLTNVAPLPLATTDPSPGHKVWALGHTGAGLWALSWGVSEGISSGVVDLLGGKLLLFDAPVYPGFSGGPVITVDDKTGQPTVVGVNHAILFTGGLTTAGTISSASSVSDIRATLAHTPLPIEAKLAAYARGEDAKVRAELFITRNLEVHKDSTMLTTAAIEGNARTVAVDEHDVARIPAVAMVFGLPKGEHELDFEVRGPDGTVLDAETRLLNVDRRMMFSTANMLFDAKMSGRYHVLTKLGEKVVGHTDVWVDDPSVDTEASDPEDTDAEDLTEPKVDVIVASAGQEKPFALAGIRAAWSEWSYPRRVDFTWYARGSKGWSGSMVSLSAYVLDKQGKIVGRGVGCISSELMPEGHWECAGAGGNPLLMAEGQYDVVFALNDRPIAMWPMDASKREPTSSHDFWANAANAGAPIVKREPKPLVPLVPSRPEKPTAKKPAPPKKPAPKPAPKPTVKPGEKPDLDPGF